MENTTPLVSVLMPVHNAEKHLEDSINSVLNQTYSNFELIVLDDCSTDRTLRIVESIARLDQRIVVLKNGNNFGIAASRNKLMQAAKGELFFNMDSDDICHKERLYKQVMFLNQNPNIMVLGSYYSHIGVSSKIIQVPTTPLEIKALLSIKNCICNSSAAFRAELFKKHNYTLNENLLVSSDYDYWCHISQKFDIANLPNKKPSL
jgi:glycosyltransferase involved in cell wall biosynthesis